MTNCTLKTGLLWFGDATRPLEEQVQRAAARHQQRHGQQPNLCLVNPADLDEPRHVGNIEIRPHRSILLHHLWIGIAEGGGR